MEKLKEWGPLIGTIAACLAAPFAVVGIYTANVNRNIDARFEAADRNADVRHEALMSQIGGLNRNVDARFEGLIGQIDGLQKQIDGLQRQVDGLNRNADTRFEGLMGQVDDLMSHVEILQRQIDGLNRNADLEFELLMGRIEGVARLVEALSDEVETMDSPSYAAQYSWSDIRALLDAIEVMMQDLHERIDDAGGAESNGHSRASETQPAAY